MQRVKSLIPFVILLCGFLLDAYIATNASAIEAEWIGGPTGSWSDPTNWSTGVVPDFQTDVVIDNNGIQDSQVELGQTTFVGDLSISSGDALLISPDGTLNTSDVTLGGDLSLSGGSSLRPTGFLWIQPEGTLSLAPQADVVRTGSQNAPLWNQGIIAGAGNIFASFNLVNSGTLTSNLQGETLELRFPFTSSSSEQQVNTGEIVAENGAMLQLNSFSGSRFYLDNTDNGNDGLIEARGDSQVTINNAWVQGGVLSTSSAGGDEQGVLTLSQTTLKNLRLEGSIRFVDATLTGMIENNSVPADNNIPLQAFINISGRTTLTGSGRLELNGGSMRAQSGYSTPGAVLIHGVDHTIAGPGQIGLFSSFTIHALNKGTIENSEQVLSIDVNSGVPFENSGTIRAFEGGNIEFRGFQDMAVVENSIDGTPGLIEADVNSEVSLQSLTVRGGTLRAVAPEPGSGDSPGIISMISGSGGSMLVDVRLEGLIGDLNSRWTLSGDFENTGTLSASVLSIHDQVTLTGGGQVRLNGWISRDSSTPQSLRQLVNQDNIIGGNGSMQISTELWLVNRGTIQADEAGKQLILNQDYEPTFTNSGQLVATNGGELRLTGTVINFEGSTPGIIRAEDSSSVKVEGIEGGILTTQGSGEIIADSPAGFKNVHNQGKIRLESFTTIQGTFQNDGIVDAQTGFSPVNFSGPVVELSGNGLWTESLLLHVGSNDSATFLIHGADHTIEGTGTIQVLGGQLINHGTIKAQRNGLLTIDLQSGTKLVQQGTLRALDQQNLVIKSCDERFKNEGLIDVEGTFRLDRTLAGPLEFINAPGAEVHLGGEFSNFSIFAADGQSQRTFWNQAGAVLEGGGRIFAPNSHDSALLRNSGVMRITGTDPTQAQLFINGDFQQDTTGSLELDLSGMFDSLALYNNHVSLAGSLNIALVDGFDPSIGDAFEIITTQGGTVTGAFDSFTAPALAGRWWQLDYLTDKVVLNVAAITADFDNSGFVDGDDLTAWQTAYGVSALADADGDGDSDGQDFLAWQRQFGSGVPPASTQAVPEPASWWLIACFFAGLFVCRRNCASF